MQEITFNKEKDVWLYKTRGIGFTEIIRAVEDGRLIKTIQHPNQTLYRNQKLWIININDYAYVVPFRETQKTINLITIFQSRKYTKKYIINSAK